MKVVVYGTLMTGERNYRFGAGAWKRTPCTITGTLYDTGYGYPAFVPEGDTAVKAELLVVSPAVLLQMDNLEGYPRLYRREAVTATVNGEKVEALVYVMNHLPEHAKIIASGDWCNYRNQEDAKCAE